MSPLKALAVDVERNLRAPLDGYPTDRRPTRDLPPPDITVSHAHRRHARPTSAACFNAHTARTS